MTEIEWTDETWNPISGCARVSAGCDHCYAVTMTHRLEAMGQSKYAGLTVLNPKGERHFNGQVRCHEDALEIPLRWKKPRRIFVNSMSDLFHKDVPFEFVDEVFAVMAMTPQHTYQVLTKRPERMAEYLNAMRDVRYAQNEVSQIPTRGWIAIRMNSHHMKGVKNTYPLSVPVEIGTNWPLPNVHLGTSAENQKAADERIPHLLKCPAVVRFLSIEPLLGPVDLGDDFWESGNRVSWVIVGCESGGKARDMKPEWAQSIADQCRSAGIPFFMKQMMVNGKLCGELHEFPESLRVREMPEVKP